MRRARYLDDPDPTDPTARAPKPAQRIADEDEHDRRTELAYNSAVLAQSILQTDLLRSIDKSANLSARADTEFVEIARIMTGRMSALFRMAFTGFAVGSIFIAVTSLVVLIVVLLTMI